MSTHTFAIADPRRVTDIVLACHDAGRAPGAVAFDGAALVLGFTPDLSPAEVATLADLVAAYGTILTLADYRAIKADAAALKSYLGVASPTAAQTAAAVKAVVRVLATIIRS